MIFLSQNFALRAVDVFKVRVSPSSEHGDAFPARNV